MDAFFQKISSGIFALLISIAGLFGTVPVQPETYENLGAQNAVAGEVYFLSGSGVSATQTMIDLTKFGYTKPDKTYQKFTMANFGDLGCGTFDPGINGKQEFTSFTGITQNADGTAQLTGVSRGLERFSPYSASSTLRTNHVGSSKFVVSNSPPCFYENYVTIKNAETITSVKTFASTTPPKYDASYTASGNEFTSFNQVNAIVIQGGSTSTESVLGLTMLATAVQAASSVASSTSGAPLVLLSRYAGNTYHAASSSILVMTGSSNTIDANFIATTSAYSFTGDISFVKATSTSFAISGSAFSWNGLDYRGPSVQGASSTVWKNNGSGSWVSDFTDGYQCGEQILSAANSTTTVTIAARKDLEIIFDSPGASGNAVPTITFNTDFSAAGTNYGHRHFTNYASAGGTTGRASIETASVATTTAVSFEATMRNTATIQKRILFEQTAGNLNHSIFTGIGTWNNATDQVTTINVTTGTVGMTWNAGTRLTVFCSKD